MDLFLYFFPKKSNKKGLPQSPPDRGHSGRDIQRDLPAGRQVAERNYVDQ